MPRPRSRPIALAALVALAACGPLVQIGGNAPAPAALLTLRAEPPPAPVAVAATPVDTARAVTVAFPFVPGALRTLRVPVVTTATELQYFPNAQWVEQPPALFRALLADVLTARGVVVLDRRATAAGAGRVLGGELVEFGLDARVAGAAVVRVHVTAPTDRLEHG